MHNHRYDYHHRHHRYPDDDTIQQPPVYFVAIDTRGLPATDLREGFQEVACPHYYFLNNVVNGPNTKCIICPLSETCGLSKHMKVYFHKYYLGEGTPRPDNQAIDRERAWSEFFPIGHNNPAATLLTMDHSTGCARYNVQGVAYVVYDEGRYPISKEQVWGLCSMANSAKDIYFCDDNKKRKAGPTMLSRWCSLYRKRQWGPQMVYEPRKQKVHRDYSSIPPPSQQPWFTP